MGVQGSYKKDNIRSLQKNSIKIKIIINQDVQISGRYMGFMKKKVLFLCTENSCRSQMAEGILRHLMGNEFEVFSAGIRPSAVNPIAIKVMAEIGIDISGHRSKLLDEFQGMGFDFVITTCDAARRPALFFLALPAVYTGVLMTRQR